MSRGTWRRPAPRSSPAMRRTAASGTTSRAQPGSRSRSLPSRSATARTSSACSCSRSSGSTSSTATTFAFSRCSPGMPRLPSRTPASTKQSGARRMARRLCSSSRASSRPARELDAVAERVVRGAVRILEVPRASLWLPLEDDAGLECLSRWPDDDDPAYAHPGDRLPPRALRLLADKTDPFVIRQRGSSRDGRPGLQADACRGVCRWRRSRSTGATAGLALTLCSGRDARRTAARPARRHRRAGEAGPDQCALLREPRAHVPLDGRGPRQRARGEG